MENQVIMSLDDYTKLITENALLKNKMQGLKSRAEQEIQNDIKDSLISNMPKEKVILYLEEENHNKVLDALYSYNSSWHWESIASKYLIITSEEAKEMAYAAITKCLNYRLADINEEETKNG